MATRSEPPDARSTAPDEGVPLFGEGSAAGEGIFLGDPDAPAARRTKQAPVGSSAGSDRPQTAPQTWEEQFLALVHNRAKSARSRDGVLTGPYRTGGFLVLARGSASLQRVQALCHRPGQSYNTCLTARYRLRPPVVGNLLAALVTDLARLAQGTGAPVGDLLPLTSGLSTPPWATLRHGPFAELAAEARLDQYTGELPVDWVSRLYEVLADPALLPVGVRLVVFAEVDGPTQPGDWDGLIAVSAVLPERFGIVLSGVPESVHPPRELAWVPDATDRTGPCLELDIGPGPEARAFKYIEAPLSGDTPAEVDALNLRRYARGLSRLVLLPGTGPMTIGVHAPWGRGKTSFMRFIEWELVRNAPVNRTAHDQLAALTAAEHDLADASLTRSQRDDAQKRRDELLARLRRTALRDVIPVWFNAWRYEGATQIWAGLTHEISEQMEQALPWHRRVWARVIYAVRNQGAAFWVGTVLPTVAALILTALVLGLGLDALEADPGNELPTWVGWLVAIAPATSVVALGSYLAWRFSRVLTPVSERLLDYVRQPDYREHMGYQHQVLRDIQFLMSRLGPDEDRPRVVVFIDDLDRCSDQKVLETLQAINLLLTASGCYVFLGIDTHMIAQAVAREYGLEEKEDRARAESYLRKIIQLSFRLPVPEQDQRLTLLTQFFSGQAQRDYSERVARARASAGLPAPPPAPGRPAPRATAPASGYGWSSADVSTPPVYEIADVEDTVEELDAFASLRDVVPENPRELKRLANLHRLVKILVQRPEAPPTTATQRLLVAWLVFCFVHPDTAERLLEGARTTCGATELHSPELDVLLARLNRDRADDEASVLTAAGLAPGTPLAEAAAISALFQEQAAAAGSADGAVPPQRERT
jgi:hypothetical protein